MDARDESRDVDVALRSLCCRSYRSCALLETEGLSEQRRRRKKKQGWEVERNERASSSVREAEAPRLCAEEPGE